MFFKRVFLFLMFSLFMSIVLAEEGNITSPIVLHMNGTEFLVGSFIPITIEGVTTNISIRSESQEYQYFGEQHTLLFFPEQPGNYTLQAFGITGEHVTLDFFVVGQISPPLNLSNTTHPILEQSLSRALPFNYSVSLPRFSNVSTNIVSYTLLLSKNISMIKWAIDGGHFLLFCRNCDSVSKKYFFEDGNHTLTFQFVEGNETVESIHYLFVDS